MVKSLYDRGVTNHPRPQTAADRYPGRPDLQTAHHLGALTYRAARLLDILDRCQLTDTERADVAATEALLAELAQPKAAA